MHLSITPLDTVFFRDGKAFTMGEESQADGLFPPPPSVVYGALRTRYFTEHPDELPKAEEPEDPTGTARITGLGLRRGGGTLFPLPRDLVQQQRETAPEVVSLRPVAGDALPGSTPVPAPLTHPATVESVEGGYLHQRDLTTYLHSADWSTTYRYHREEDLVQTESKVGIKQNRATRGAQEGHLYRIGFRRLAPNVSLSVDVHGLPLRSSGLLKVGGEGKAARFQTLDQEWPHPDPPLEAIRETGCFKAYLATPALFESGWLPSVLDAETLQGRVGSAQFSLYAAAVGKSVYIGGWDMKEGKPKPMLKAVPAGSVYYFRLQDGTPEGVADAWHAKSISDERAPEGFGLCYVGAARPPRSP